MFTGVVTAKRGRFHSTGSTIPSKDLNLLPQYFIPPFDYIPKIHPQFPELSGPSGPRIRKTNSYDVEFEYPKLQHGFVWNFTPLYIAFDSWESTRSFSIDYTIHAGNVIDDLDGRLSVVIGNV